MREAKTEAEGGMVGYEDAGYALARSGVKDVTKQ